LLSEVFVII